MIKIKHWPFANDELKKLAEWLRANSSGIYRPAALAADVIIYQQAEIERLNFLIQPASHFYPVGWCRTDDLQDALRLNCSFNGWIEPGAGKYKCDLQLYARRPVDGEMSNGLVSIAEQFNDDELKKLAEWLQANELALLLSSPSDDELLRAYGRAKRDFNYEGPSDDWPKRAERAATLAGLRAILARWGTAAFQLQPSTAGEVRYEFEIMDAEGERQVFGESRTLEDARREGLRYLAMYSQDGPHRLELRRVEVISPTA